jgi:hypothetical protein
MMIIISEISSDDEKVLYGFMRFYLVQILSFYFFFLYDFFTFSLINDQERN